MSDLARSSVGGQFCFRSAKLSEYTTVCRLKSHKVSVILPLELIAEIFP